MVTHSTVFQPIADTLRWLGLEEIGGAAMWIAELCDVHQHLRISAQHRQSVPRQHAPCQPTLPSAATPVYAVSIVFFTLNIVAIGLLASSTLSVKKSESITHLKKNGRIVKIAPRVNWPRALNNLCRGVEQTCECGYPQAISSPSPSRCPPIRGRSWHWCRR